MRTYDSYKNSGIEWIGEIPIHWNIIRLSNVFRVSSEKNHPNEMNLSVYRDYGVIPTNSRDDNHNKISEDTSQYKLVEVGDFVMNKMKCWMGSIGLSLYRGIVSPSYTVLKIINENVFPSYYHSLLRSSTYIPEYRRLSYGVRVGQWDLRFEDFREIPVPLPPISEQEQIVSYLDEKTSLIDEMVEKKKRKIGLLKEYRTSLINTVVTKGLNPDVPMKDSGIEWIGEIPRHWEVKRFKDCHYEVDEIVGSDWSKYSLLSLTKNGVVKRDIESGIGKFPESFETYKKVGFNDLIFCLYDIEETPRTVGLSKLNGMITGSYKIIKSINVIPEYTYYVYLTIDDSKGLKPYYTGLRNTVRTDTFNSIKYILPPLSEQEQIVSYLDEKTSEIDKTIELENKKIELLKEYRQSLISNVVTGKIKVVSE